jgi:hypothetical protein
MVFISISGCVDRHIHPATPRHAPDFFILRQRFWAGQNINTNQF